MSNYLNRLAVRSTGISPNTRGFGNPMAARPAEVDDPFEAEAAEVALPTPGRTSNLVGQTGIPLPHPVDEPRYENNGVIGRADLQPGGRAIWPNIGESEREALEAQPARTGEALEISPRNQQPDLEDDPAGRQKVPLAQRSNDAEKLAPAPGETLALGLRTPPIRVRAGRMEDLWTTEKQAQAMQILQGQIQAQQAILEKRIEAHQPENRAQNSNSPLPIAPAPRQELLPGGALAEPRVLAPSDGARLVIGSLRVEVLPTQAPPQPAITIVHSGSRNLPAPPIVSTGLRFGLGQM